MNQVLLVDLNHRREQYYAWKQECRQMVPLVGSGKFVTTAVVAEDGQPLKESSVENQGWLVKTAITDKRVLHWMLVLSQIGLDVVRTDWYLCFYESESNQARLWNVLAVYTWLNPDISYVQETNDICSPMIILLEDEADAFWCFERAMRRLRENFRTTATSMGVQTQLGMLSQVIKTVDPRLHQHLEDLDGGEYLFAIRIFTKLYPKGRESKPKLKPFSESKHVLFQQQACQYWTRLEKPWLGRVAVQRLSINFIWSLTSA